MALCSVEYVREHFTPEEVVALMYVGQQKLVP
jgi:hypothetical protein